MAKRQQVGKLIPPHCSAHIQGCLRNPLSIEITEGVLVPVGALVCSTLQPLRQKVGFDHQLTITGFNIPPQPKARDVNCATADAELWNALRESHLVGANNASNEPSQESEKAASSMSKITLDGPVDEEGSNYSLGQRQLLAFARAMVRDSRIIVIDEGTSSIDAETDMNIQETIASAERPC
ncbi:hypothetical protein HFD88_007278 [Aspergillus terreus]|nr:hypothetical protein HFD88_007278 [Aspergillus terreus]